MSVTFTNNTIHNGDGNGIRIVEEGRDAVRDYLAGAISFDTMHGLLQMAHLSAPPGSFAARTLRICGEATSANWDDETLHRYLTDLLTVPHPRSPAVEALWDLCATDGWYFDGGSDQWWLITGTCQHGKWTGVSDGQVDLEAAFWRIYEQAKKVQHPEQETP